jgi:hypothetical protein
MLKYTHTSAHAHNAHIRAHIQYLLLLRMHHAGTTHCHTRLSSTLLLHCCHIVATLLSHCCYMTSTLEWYTVVTLILHLMRRAELTFLRGRGTHTHRHTHTHTHTHTRTHNYTCKHIHTEYTHSHTNTHTHTHKHAHTHIYIRTHTHRRTLTHTNAGERFICGLLLH